MNSQEQALEYYSRVVEPKDAAGTEAEAEGISLPRAALVGLATGLPGLVGSKVKLPLRILRALKGAGIGTGLSLGAQAARDKLVEDGTLNKPLADLLVTGTEIAGGYSAARALTKTPNELLAANIADAQASQSTKDTLQGAMKWIEHNVKESSLAESEIVSQKLRLTGNETLGEIGEIARTWKELAAEQAQVAIDGQMKIITEQAPKNYSKMTKFLLKVGPALAAPEGLLKRIGPVGEFISDKMREANFMERNISGKWASDLADIHKTFKFLGKERRVLAGKVLDKLMDETGSIDAKRLAKATDPDLAKALDDPNVVDYAKSMRKWYNGLADFLQENDAYIIENGNLRRFKKKDFYYTHQLDQDELRKPETREIMIKYLMDTEDITRTDAVRKADKELVGFLHGTNIGYLKKRKGTPPEFRHLLLMDPLESANIYLASTARHLAHQKTFGHNYDFLSKVAGSIPDTPDGGGALARRYLYDIVNEYKRSSYSTPGAEMLRELRAFSTMTKMLGAQVANATQGGQTISYVGAKRFFPALAKNITGSERELLVDTGNYTQQATQELLKNMGVSRGSALQRGATAALKYSGFTWTENVLNRNTAVIAGKLYLKDIAKKLTLNKITRAEAADLRAAGVDINALLEQGPTDLDFAKMGHFVERKTQFGAKINNLPLMWRHPVAKFLLQFKNFAFSQSKFMKDIMLSTADEYFRTGSLDSLDRILRIGLLTPALSAVVMQWREFLYNYNYKDFPDYKTAVGKIPAKTVAYFTSAMGLGLAADVLDSAMRGRDLLTPPGLDPLVNIMGSVIKFDPKPLSKISVPTKAIYQNLVD